ncbi:MAG: Sjogren's syndrome/scleroderma autoantigen 1 family protein [Nanoarchaeota archaeon]
MAHLLRSGYKMLNLSCPVCNNPIFESKEGKKLCPICEREVIIKDKEKEKQSSFSTKKVNEESKKAKKKDIELKKGESLMNNDLNEVANILLEKINWIGEKIEEETQIDSIREYCKTISELFSVYSKLQKGKN